MLRSALSCRQGQISAALVAVSSLHLWNLSSHYYTQSEEAPSSSGSEPEKTVPNLEDELFENECPKRQVYKPSVPYPAWDYNWDSRMTPETSLEAVKNRLHTKVKGKTRHIILVRHGQYDESSKDDDKRKLTPLGRLQAIQTGRRLKEIMEGSNHFEKQQFRGPCVFKSILVSDMRRAKETANLIAQELGMTVSSPDSDLNEALAAPMIPHRPDIVGATEDIDRNHERIERAFQRYFWRDVPKQQGMNDNVANEEENEPQHEFEIIVCHGEFRHTLSDVSLYVLGRPHIRNSYCFSFLVDLGNVIRYFLCRALQLPPEAWLRFSTFNCSLTYLMIQPSGYVSCRMLGDIGHLKYDESTFSGWYGFNW